MTRLSRSTSRPVFAVVGVLGVLGSWSLSSQAFAREDMVEIPIRNVFVPKMGFDDNDHVELVVRSSLPNSCYSTGLNSVEMNATTRQIKVKHLAFREMNGPCAAPDEHQAAEPVAFISTLTLGRLDRNTYQIEYGGAKTRSFTVSKAPADYIDNFRYAGVNAVESPEIFGPGADVKITLSGVFNNSCEAFADTPQVQIIDDVVVILPIMAPVPEGTMCLQYLREFKEPVPIGKLSPGEYLVHARSRDGHATYRLFTVSAE